jgi:hypothetical protein
MARQPVGSFNGVGMCRLNAHGHPEQGRLLSSLRHGSIFASLCDPFGEIFQRRHYDSPLPTPATFQNHPAAVSPEFAPFVRAKLQEMESNGAIRRLGALDKVPAPCIVLPVRVEPTKRGRLICDASYVNLWCPDLPFTFENLGMLPRLADATEPLFSIDQTLGYVHVRLTEDSEPFFGFEFEGIYYVYLTLSFGWKASPFICTTAPVGGGGAFLPAA